MLKIGPRYRNLVQLFSNRRIVKFEDLYDGIEEGFLDEVQSFNGRIAHFFKAKAELKNNTNTQQYEITLNTPYIPGQTD